MIDLSVIILSCDKYSHLLEHFTRRFDKYWEPGNKYPKFITTETVKFDFPGYKSIVTDDSNWSNSLLKALEQVETPYVFLIVDDFFLVRTLSNEYINRGLEILKENNFDKYVFHYPHVVFDGKLDPTSFGSNIYKVQQDAEYTMTLQPGIWNTKFIKECLKEGESPWDFEIKGSTRANETRPHNIYMEVTDAFHKEAMSRGEFTAAYHQMIREL
jgi:hypothetical protein